MRLLFMYLHTYMYCVPRGTGSLWDPGRPDRSSARSRRTRPQHHAPASGELLALSPSVFLPLSLSHSLSLSVTLQTCHFLAPSAVVEADAPAEVEPGATAGVESGSTAGVEPGAPPGGEADAILALMASDTVSSST